MTVKNGIKTYTHTNRLSSIYVHLYSCLLTTAENRQTMNTDAVYRLIVHKGENPRAI